jgi:tetratricopeptide (TPR) repeat protein
MANAFVAIRVFRNQIVFDPHGLECFRNSARPFLIVVAGPSGSGKSTLINRLVTRRCDDGPLIVADGPNCCTTDFQCVGPVKTADFCDIWNIRQTERESEPEPADLFFIDSEGLFHQNAQPLHEADVCRGLLALSTIAGMSLWVQRSRIDSGNVENLASHIQLTNALLIDTPEKKKIHPALGLIATEVGITGSGESGVSETVLRERHRKDDSRIKQLVMKRIQGVRSQQSFFLCNQPRQHQEALYWSSMSDLAEFIARGSVGARRWSDMSALFIDVATKLQTFLPAKGPKALSLGQVWREYLQERVQAACDEAITVGRGLIAALLERLSDPAVYIGFPDCQTAAASLADEALRAFRAAVRGLELNEDESAFRYAQQQMEKIQLVLEIDAMHAIDEKLASIAGLLVSRLEETAAKISRDHSTQATAAIGRIPFEEFSAFDLRAFVELQLNTAADEFAEESAQIYPDCDGLEIWQDIEMRLALTLVSKIREAYRIRLVESDHYFAAADNQRLQEEIERESAQFERARAEQAERYRQAEEELNRNLEIARQKWKAASKELQQAIKQETENTRMLIVESANQSREFRLQERLMRLEYGVESVDQSLAQLRIDHELGWNHQMDMAILGIDVTMNEGDLTRKHVSIEHSRTRHHVSDEHAQTRNHVSHVVNDAAKQICQLQLDIAQHQEEFMRQAIDGVHQHLTLVDEHGAQRTNMILNQGVMLYQMLDRRIVNSTAMIVDKVEFEGALTRKHIDQGFASQRALICECTDQMLDGIQVVRLEQSQYYRSLHTQASDIAVQQERRATWRHRIQMAGHLRTQSQLKHYHLQDQEWQHSTTASLKQMHTDIKRTTESVGGHMDSKIQMGPLSLGAEDGALFMDWNFGGPHVGINTKGEVKLGYAGSVGFASGSADAVVPLFNPKGLRFEATGEVEAGSAKAKAKAVVPVFDLGKSKMTGSATLGGGKGGSASVDFHVPLGEIEKAHCSGSAAVQSRPWMRCTKPLG